MDQRGFARFSGESEIEGGIEERDKQRQPGIEAVVEGIGECFLPLLGSRLSGMYSVLVRSLASCRD